MKEAIIGLIIAVIIVSAVFLYQFNKPEKVEEKPEPKPEPPKEEEEPIEEKPEPKIFNIKLSEEGDQTENLLNQLRAIPSGTRTKEIDVLAGDWKNGFSLVDTSEFVHPVIVRFPKGRFLTEGVFDEPSGKEGIIRIKDKHNWVIEAEGCTLYSERPQTPINGNISKGDYSRRRHFIIDTCTHIYGKFPVIEGCNKIPESLIGTTPELTPEWWEEGKTMSSTHPTAALYLPYWEFEHGIEIFNSQNIVLNEPEVYNVMGDGIYIGNYTSNPSLKIAIIKPKLFMTGRQAIAAAQARYIFIDEPHFKDNGRSGFDPEPFSNDGFVTDVHIRNGKYYQRMTPVAAMGRGDVSRIHVDGGEYIGGAFTVVRDSAKKKRRSDFYIHDIKRMNQFGSPSATFKFYMVDNVLIENTEDTLASTQGRLAAYFYDCHNGTFRNNKVKNGEYVMVRGDSTIDIHGNTPELKIK